MDGHVGKGDHAVRFVPKPRSASFVTDRATARAFRARQAAEAAILMQHCFEPSAPRTAEQAGLPILNDGEHVADEFVEPARKVILGLAAKEVFHRPFS